jgi:cyanophycinase-like exopeptidase
MALSDWAPRMRDLVHPNQPTGLRLVQQVRVIPHFDKMLGWMPDMLRNALLHKPEGTTLIGIDEDTALVSQGHGEWEVQGRQSVWVLGQGSRVEHKPGTTLTLP